MPGAERRPLMNYGQVEAFRQALPPRQQHETFRFFVVTWDIVRARYLIQQTRKTPDALRVASAARAYGLDKPQTIDSVVHIDEAWAMSEAIDTNIPVILALIQGDEGTPPRPILLDGLHRLYKAFREGKETIPCYALSPEEERQCRM